MNLDQSIQNYDEDKSLSFLFDIKEQKNKLFNDSFLRKNKTKIINYGKFDVKGNIILPKKEKLVNNFFDFVEEMFTSFQNYMKFSVLRGVVQTSRFSNIQIKKDFVLAEDMYEMHLVKTKEIILERVDRQQEINKNTNIQAIEIKNIYDFVNFMKRDLIQNNIINNIILTKTSYMTSNIVSPISTGLILEIDNEGYNDERYKLENYYDNPDFTFYVNAANRFGFMIDANIPWRLIVNLNSPFVIGLLNKKNIFSLDKFFEEYYNAFKEDLINIVNYINNIYSDYINLNPLFKESIFKQNNTLNRLRNKNIKLINFNSDFNLIFDLFIEIILKEQNCFNEYMLTKINKIVKKRKKTFDKKRLSEYVLCVLNRLLFKHNKK